MKKAIRVLAIVGVLSATLSTSVFASTNGDKVVENTSIEDIMKVYEENKGNGMLLAPNPNESEDVVGDTGIDEIMEVYEENAGNGMLLAPNPNASESSVENGGAEDSMEVSQENKEEKESQSLLEKISSMLGKLLEWFKTI